MNKSNAETNLRSIAMKAANFPRDMIVVELDAAIDYLIQAREEGRKEITGNDKNMNKENKIIYDR